jgi:hypothetical protein
MCMSEKVRRRHDYDIEYVAKTVIADTTGTRSWQTNGTQTRIHINQ